MNDEASKVRLARLEETVSKLVGLAEVSHNASRETAISRIGREVKTEAIISVLVSIVSELAGRAGLSEEEFQKHYDKRYQYFYNLGLQAVEDIAPDQAASIDGRTIAESDAPETFPPLFDEQA